MKVVIVKKNDPILAEAMTSSILMARRVIIFNNIKT